MGALLTKGTKTNMKHSDSEPGVTWALSPGDPNRAEIVLQMVEHVGPTVALDLARSLRFLADDLDREARAQIAEGAVPQGTRTSEPTPPEADRLLTPQEAAIFLNLSVEQLRRRNLPKKKLGRRTVRYSLAALRRYLSRN